MGEARFGQFAHPLRQLHCKFVGSMTLECYRRALKVGRTALLSGQQRDGNERG